MNEQLEWVGEAAVRSSEFSERMREISREVVNDRKRMCVEMSNV